MRRIGIAVVVLATVMVMALFFGDFLTGRTNIALQDPYSHIQRTKGSRFGLPYDTLVENPMSQYYYQTLQQPRDYVWEQEGKSYQRPIFSTGIIYDTSPIVPVVFLDITVELEFLQALPDNKVRVAVIHSLYTPRKPTTEKDAEAWNQHLQEVEKARVGRIVQWHEVDRLNYGVTFNQWWDKTAALFGLHPDGTLLTQTTSPQAKKP